MESLRTRIGPRKVCELHRKLIESVPLRLLIANELRTTELVVESVEVSDGSRPRLLIRITRAIRKRRLRKHR